MGKSQRTKGAVYERELADQFSEALGGKFKRNIGQARDGGNDIDAGVWIIEAKRRKELKTLEGHMDQATRAARRHGPLYRERREALAGRALSPMQQLEELRRMKVPIVVMRADSGRSMVLIDLEDFFDTVRGEHGL